MKKERIYSTNTVMPKISLAHHEHDSILESLMYRSVLLAIGLSVLYLLPIALTGSNWFPVLALDLSAAEVTTSLMQCLLGAAAIHIPLLFQKLTHIKLPGGLCAFFYVFVLCATVLGEVFSLYYIVPVWDSLLHFGSGVLLGMLGNIILASYLHRKNLHSMLTPVFVAITSVAFALCLGTVWEIYEFAADNLLGLNMQKTVLQDGTILTGKFAVLDTMKDLIVNLAGSILAAASSYLSIKFENGWLYGYTMNRAVPDIPAKPDKNRAQKHSALQKGTGNEHLCFGTGQRVERDSRAKSDD